MGGISTYEKTIREFLFSRNLGTYWGYDKSQPSMPITNVNIGLYNLPFYKEFGEDIYGKEKYINYIDFFNKVYGQVTPPIQFVEGLIGTQFLSEAIKNDSPAVVYPEPKVSMAGIVKTNINNYSGVDTRLGLLSNQIYGYKMFVAANFNTLRKETNSYYKSFITPHVSKRFGNTQANVNSLTTITSPLRSDGRIIEDYNSDVKIIHNKAELNATKTIEYPERLKYRISEKKERNENGEVIKARASDGRVVVRNVQVRDTYPNATMVVSDVNLNTTLLKKSLENLNKWVTSKTDRPIVKDGIPIVPGKKFSILDNSFYELSGTSINERVVSKPFPTRSLYGNAIQHYIYTDNTKNTEIYGEFNNDIYQSIDAFKEDTLSRESIIYKTNSLFKEHLATSFNFDDFICEKYGPKTISDTSTSGFGRSRGRNLLKSPSAVLFETNTKINGKYNPFCRTWTYHHQYDRYDKAIRPISDDRNGNLLTHEETQNLNKHRRSFNQKMGDNGIVNGAKYLADNSVLDNDTTLINIAPSKIDNIDIKKCMFSIENLAWKDVLNKEEYLSKEQRGPNGGRIMWFPPYDLNFNESTNVNWESNSFIGRGEKIYTYSDTDRTGTLSFTLLVDNPSMLQNMYNESGAIETNLDTDNLFNDDDILKFFAGEVLLKSQEVEIKTEPNYRTDYETIPAVTKDLYDTININVYFPFNYSGKETKELKYSAKSYNYNTEDKKFEESGNGSYHEYVFTEKTSDKTIPICYSGDTVTIDKEKIIQTTPLSYLVKGYSIGTFENKKLKFNGQDIESSDIHPNIGYEMIYKKNQMISTTNNTEGDTKKYHFIIVLDVSGSMNTNNKFNDAKKAILTFLEGRKESNDEFSLVLYEEYGCIYKDSETSIFSSTQLYDSISGKDKNRSYFSNFISKDRDKHKVGYQGGTIYRSGLYFVKKILTSSNKNMNVCVFFSDGLASDSTQNSDDVTVKFKGILDDTKKIKKSAQMYTIGIGVSQHVMVNGQIKIVKSKEVETEAYQLLKAMASEDKDDKDKKKVFLPNNLNSLNEAFENISKENTNKTTYYKPNGTYTLSSSFYEYRKSDKLFEPTGRTCDKIDCVNPNITGQGDEKEYITEEQTGEGYFRTLNFISNGGENSDKYYYLVDSDAIGNENKIYQVEKQTQLNLQRKDDPNTRNYSFCEFIYSLLQIKTGKKTQGATGTQGTTETAFDKECFEVAHHMETNIEKFKEGTIYNKDLIDLLTKEIERIKFEIIPSMKNDEFQNGNDNMATRRGQTIKDLLVKLGCKNVEINNKPQSGEGKSNQCVTIKMSYPNGQTEIVSPESIREKQVYIGDKITKTKIDPIYRRYENEAEYFTKLKHTDPLLHKRIIEKFKYFNPAFHSMSPEGFNARLTFLHQCTRQGNTLEIKKRADGLQQDTEGHMSFGRMPVCVLRIGDFINTKILINNVQIRHGKDSMQWDLNPESIGVQPMMATVSMSITIIGGQSLESPVNHLQNAVSFNYYANTGVYDDRAFRARPTEGTGKNVEGSTVWGTDHYYTWLPLHENND